MSTEIIIRGSWAIFSVNLWLVPTITYSVRAHLRAARASSSSGSTAESDAAVQTVYRSVILAVVLALALTAGLAAGVALSTQLIDSRMKNIIIGLSMLVSAVVLGKLACEIPGYMSVSGANCPVPESSGRESALPKPPAGGSDSRALRRRVVRCVLGHFAKVYFLLSIFYCGVTPASIPASMVVGAAVGTVIVLFLDFANARLASAESESGPSKRRMNSRTKVALAIVVVLSGCSAALFANGCLYIDRVWGANEDNNLVLGLVGGLLWFGLAFAVGIACTRTSLGLREGNGSAKNPRSTVAMGHDNGSNESAPGNEENSKDEDDSIANKDMSTEEDKAAGVGLTKETAATSIEEGDDMNSTSLSTKKKCCGCCCNPNKSKSANVFNVLKWTALVVVSALFFFITIANIGASQETSVINNEFPKTEKALYTNMDDGPVCAIDNPSLRENATMETFASASLAKVANYTIAHCGDCAACSVWHNLCLEWTDAQLLFKYGKTCGMEGTFKGSSAALKCEEDLIGWNEECAMCWSIDAMCAAHACIWIGLQSAFINALSDEAVEPGAVTAASCEEAMCERETLKGPYKGAQGFVPCSGASRRRMGVQSSIARPASELCGVVEMDWLQYCGPQTAA